MPPQSSFSGQGTVFTPLRIMRVQGSERPSCTGDIWFLTCWDWKSDDASAMGRSGWQGNAVYRRHARCRYVLPLCGSGLHSAALEHLRSYACPRDRSATTCHHYSAKERVNFESEGFIRPHQQRFQNYLWHIVTILLLPHFIGVPQHEIAVKHFAYLINKKANGLNLMVKEQTHNFLFWKLR